MIGGNPPVSQVPAAPPAGLPRPAPQPVPGGQVPPIVHLPPAPQPHVPPAGQVHRSPAAVNVQRTPASTPASVQVQQTPPQAQQQPVTQKYFTPINILSMVAGGLGIVAGLALIPFLGVGIGLTIYTFFLFPAFFGYLLSPFHQKLLIS